jgi:hypothetical protein
MEMPWSALSLQVGSSTDDGSQLDSYESWVSVMKLTRDAL